MKSGVSWICDALTACRSSQKDMLRTPHLNLRPCTRDDTQALHQIWIDPGVRKYLWDDRVISEEEALDVVRDSLGSFSERGFGLWVVTMTGSPRIMGFCGLRLFGDLSEVEIL